tara:strand:- start:202 stop:1002 length:801 start_codon:yes stop_codon:yes gene_type:complete
MFGHLVDTSETLAQTVNYLNNLDPKPDVILATGDLTDDGTEAQYEILLDILSPILDRLLPLPGNHDDLSAFQSAFTDQLPSSDSNEHCSYTVEDHPIRLIGLDTSITGRHDGCFNDSHEIWLKTALDEDSDRPTLIFTHFPPFTTGLNFMDLSGLKGAERFRKIIASHPQIKLVTTGHMHRPIQTVVGSTLISVCPSTGNQLGLDLNPERGSATNEPPGYQLHRWDGKSFVTHTGVLWEGNEMDMSDFVASVIQQAKREDIFPKSS